MGGGGGGSDGDGAGDGGDGGEDGEDGEDGVDGVCTQKLLSPCREKCIFLSDSSPYSLSWILLLNLELSIWLNWLVRKLPTSSCFCLPVMRLLAVRPHPTFYMMFPKYFLLQKILQLLGLFHLKVFKKYT